MTAKLRIIPETQLSVLKKRAVLKMVEQIQRAYADASERYGMSRKEFAARIGMQPTQFSRILNGRQNVTVESAEVVLRALEARGTYGYQMLDDVRAPASNRSGSAKYKKTTDVTSSTPTTFKVHEFS